MQRDFVLERPGEAPEHGTLEAVATAGGSRSDRLHVAGAAPRAVRLEPCLTGVVAVAEGPGVRAAGRALPPGARRLVRAGESLELGGARVSFPAPSPAGTRGGAAAILREAAAGAAPSSGPHLVVLTGPDAGRRHALGPELVLGRGRRADVRIADARASRRHALLRAGPEGVLVEDLGAKNGVEVNGVRVERAPAALRAGDELGIGETLLAVEDPFGAPAPASDVPAGHAPPRRPRVPPHLAAAALLALSAAALALAGR